MAVEQGDLRTRAVIGAAIEVHRTLGPGLLESAYEMALTEEFRLRGIPFERQVAVPIVYKGVSLGSEYRVDFVVRREIVIEIKSAANLLAIHNAQLLTYLRLLGMRTGLLINFNVSTLKDGLRRVSL